MIVTHRPSLKWKAWVTSPVYSSATLVAYFQETLQEISHAEDMSQGLLSCAEAAVFLLPFIQFCPIST